MSIKLIHDILRALKMKMCWGDACMCFDAFSSTNSVLFSNVNATCIASFKKLSIKSEEIVLPDSNQYNDPQTLSLKSTQELVVHCTVYMKVEILARNYI